MKRIGKYIVLMIAFGTLYCLIELIYRQHTHWAMFVVGGLCGVACGLINEIIPWETPLWIQGVLGAGIITLVEFFSGCVFNIWLGWNIWDYSALPFNALGQVCLPFVLIWFVIAHIAIILDDYLRYWFFNEEKPHYTMWF